MQPPKHGDGNAQAEGLILPFNLDYYGDPDYTAKRAGGAAGQDVLYTFFNSNDRTFAAATTTRIQTQKESDKIQFPGSPGQ